MESELQEQKKEEETFKPNIVYKFEDVEMKKFEVGKDIFIRLIKGADKKYIDIRKYYKGYPTKKGIRMTTDIFKAAINLILDEI